MQNHELDAKVSMNDRPIRPLIIERPDLQSVAQRWGYRSLTLACWILWLHLFVPVLSFIAWFIGLTVIYQVLLQGLDFQQFWGIFYRYAVGIGVFTSTYLLWALYNLLRFRGKERRKLIPIISEQAYAESHNISVAELLELRGEDRLTVSNSLLTRMFEEHR